MLTLRTCFQLVFGFLFLCLIPFQALGSPLGSDQNGNGIWDDLDRVYGQLSGQSFIAAQQLAVSMQDFTMAPPGNQSLALEGMRKSQEALLCLYALQGESGKATAKNLQGALLANPLRAERFNQNQQTILGQEIPFDPDPEKWGQYCPFSLI